MRRVLAVLLVLVFSYPLIAPAFAGTPDDASLPACCRRNGKHHCAMYMSGMMVSVPAKYHTLQETCPYSPFSHPLLMMPHLFASQEGGLSIAQPGPEAVIREAEAGYRISMDRARHKRGPPRSLAL